MNPAALFSDLNRRSFLTHSLSASAVAALAASRDGPVASQSATSPSAIGEAARPVG